MVSKSEDKDVDVDADDTNGYDVRSDP